MTVLRNPLVLAVAQPLCLPHDVVGNVALHAEAIHTARARVVVFPELSLTGYEFDAEAIAPDDDRLTPLVETCRETGSLALVGIPLQGEGDSAQIAMLAVHSGGTEVAYRKVCVDSSEAGRFTPGTGPAVLTVEGWRLGLALCKDTGIAQQIADTAALGIDVYVAGTVMHRNEREIQDERAHRIAVKYRVAVAFASFAGPTGEGYIETAGHSGIWTAEGVLATQTGPQPGSIARAELAPPLATPDDPQPRTPRSYGELRE